MRRPIVVAAALLGAAALVGATACSSGDNNTASSGSAKSSGGDTGSSSATTAKAGTTAKATTTTAPPAPRVGTASWSLPDARAREAAAAVGGSILVAGGVGPARSTVGDTFTIDPATGATQRTGTLPVPVHDSAGAAVGDHMAVLGGGNTKPMATVQSVPHQGAPTLMPAKLPTPRADLSATTIGDTVYAAGGYDGNVAVLDVTTIAANGTVASAGKLAEGARYAAVAPLGTTLYAIGGELGGKALDAVQALDTTTGAAKVIGRLPQPRGHAVAFVLGGRLFIAGGRTIAAGEQGGAAATFTGEVDQVDPSTGALTPVGTLPTAVSDLAVAVVGDTAYLLGGITPAGPTKVVQTVSLAKA